MNREKTVCTEWKSEYYKDSSEMMYLCPDCAHRLYGFSNCEHEFESGKCSRCSWNGLTSEYLKNRAEKNGN